MEWTLTTTTLAERSRMQCGWIWTNMERLPSAEWFPPITGRVLHVFISFIQEISTRQFPGLVNFVPAIAYHFCLNLAAAFSQLGNSLIEIPCTGPANEACAWLWEISSSSCLSDLPGPAWLLLNKTCIPCSKDGLHEGPKAFGRIISHRITVQGTSHIKPP